MPVGPQGVQGGQSGGGETTEHVPAELRETKTTPAPEANKPHVQVEAEGDTNSQPELADTQVTSCEIQAPMIVSPPNLPPQMSASPTQTSPSPCSLGHVTARRKESARGSDGGSSSNLALDEVADGGSRGSSESHPRLILSSASTPTEDADAEGDEATSPSARHPDRARKCLFYSNKFWGLAALGIASTLATAIAWEVWQNGREFQSITQQLGGFACQMSVVALSTYLSVLSRLEQFYLILPSRVVAPRQSSRLEIGFKLGQTYDSLSQAVAVSNSLFPVPNLVSKMRADATGFRVEEGSTVLEPLQQFMSQSRTADRDVYRLMLNMGQLGTLALREWDRTNALLEYIEFADYWFTFGPLRLVGLSGLEARLQERLKQHVEALLEKVVGLDRLAREVLAQYDRLSFTTGEIREACAQDQKRLIGEKGDEASQLHWLFRVSIHLLHLPEPEKLAAKSRNIAIAQSIDGWAKGIADCLRHLILETTQAHVNVNALLQILNHHGAITWTTKGRNSELVEFLAQMAEGVMLLDTNTLAWKELRASEYL